MQDEAPPEGEMLESQAIDQGAREDEIAELQDKLNSVTKSYEDLRPHADRALVPKKKRIRKIRTCELGLQFLNVNQKLVYKLKNLIPILMKTFYLMMTKELWKISLRL